jgi:hypothetical protein
VGTERDVFIRTRYAFGYVEEYVFLEAGVFVWP